MRNLPVLFQPPRIITVDVDLDIARRQDETVQLLREFLTTIAKLADLSREDKPDDSGGVAGH